MALGSEPESLNPLVFSTAVAGMIYAEMHDGLTELDESLQYGPSLATSWQIAADRKSVTYNLRPWNWSDGTPLTARDVVHSCELFRDPVVASPRRGTLREVARVVALDSATVRYEFDRPQSDPLARSYHLLVPYHLTAEADRGAVGEWAIGSTPLASGAFRLAAWERGRSLVLERNPAYPGPAARLDRVVFRVLPESSTRLVALETGEVDVVDGIGPDAAARLAEGQDVTVVPVGGRRFYYLGWNCRRPQFTDADTRRALGLAIDRGLMVGTLLRGYGKPAQGPIPPVMWNHHRELSPPERDVAEARRLLAAAGWEDDDGDGILSRDGTDLSCEIVTRQGDPVRENGAVILRAQLAEVGVDVRLRVMEHAAGLARVRAGDYDAYLGLLNANLFGDPTPYVGSDATDQFNFGHYANATVDSLLGVARGLRVREAALPVWHAVQEELAADPPVAYLMYPDNVVGVSRRLRDVRPHLLSPLNNLAEWWVAPADRKYRSGR